MAAGWWAGMVGCAGVHAGRSSMRITIVALGILALTLASAAGAAGAAGASAARAADTPLIDAVKAGDAEAVRTLLADGVAVSEAEADETTALHWAAHHDDLEIAQLLLDAGAAVDATNRYDVVPLALASSTAARR